MKGNNCLADLIEHLDFASPSVLFDLPVLSLRVMEETSGEERKELIKKLEQQFGLAADSAYLFQLKKAGFPGTVRVFGLPEPVCFTPHSQGHKLNRDRCQAYQDGRALYWELQTACGRRSKKQEFTSFYNSTNGLCPFCYPEVTNRLNAALDWVHSVDAQYTEAYAVLRLVVRIFRHKLEESELKLFYRSAGMKQLEIIGFKKRQQTVERRQLLAVLKAAELQKSANGKGR